MDTIDVTYILRCPPAAAAKYAQAIALEQTVEVPAEIVERATGDPSVVGEVAALEPLDGDPDRHRALIRYRADLAAGQLAQLLNLIYGNISIKNNIRIADVQLPPALLQRFRGPRYGCAGIRAALGIYDRPLLATAIKPRGANLDHLAKVAHDFTLAGGDLVKDDHNLVDATFDDFALRVTRCQNAVQAANAETGRHAIYLPHLMAPADQLERYAEFLVNLGIRGVLICPFILGLDTLRLLGEHYPLITMAHPALSGTFFHDEDHGMDPAVLLGTLMRVAGADASIFPNHGGRFTFTPQRCQRLAQALSAPLGTLAPAFPTPAGGMRFENLPALSSLYGSEAIFLIGGALLSYGMNLQDSTAAFLERICEQFTPRIVEPPAPTAALPSSCDMPATSPVADLLTHLRFNADFTWAGRAATEYKADGALPFADISRQELVGRQGERAAFDLRYFQIEPRGYSSREKHRHTHTIICVRGAGALEIDGVLTTLRPLDIAYVPPLAVHQIRNDHDEPFGFFCIVDRVRDRPLAP